MTMRQHQNNSMDLCANSQTLLWLHVVTPPPSTLRFRLCFGDLMRSKSAPQMRFARNCFARPCLCIYNTFMYTLYVFHRCGYVLSFVADKVYTICTCIYRGNATKKITFNSPAGKCLCVFFFSLRNKSKFTSIFPPFFLRLTNEY